MSTCKEQGCEKRAHARGLCDTHYRRLRRGPAKRPINRPVAERFWEKVSRGNESECWEWQAYKDGEGYGRFYTKDGKKKAHRAAYELEIGEIPEGAVIDHRCGNRSCVNPAHLRLATQLANAQYRTRVGAANQSGARNVYWDKKRLKWVAMLKVKGRRIELGAFDLFADAEQRAKEGRAEHYEFPDYDTEVNK